MAGMSTANMDHLTRSEIWSSQLKDVWHDELMAQQYVNWLSEFPDGNTFTIPSIGDLPVRNYAENNDVVYDAIDTGEFQFSITEYVSSATYITNKAKQDAFYVNQLTSQFVPKMNRAIAEHVEAKIFNLQSQQTASDGNAINGADHRWVAAASTTTTAGILSLDDIAKAKYSLQRALAPMTGLTGIIDPSQEYQLQALASSLGGALSFNQRWANVVESGISTGMKFVFNIYGFDIYVSNHLATVTETIDSAWNGYASSTVTNGKANLFFSADSSALPFIGAWRQSPTVESSYNKDKQRDEYLTVARYGVKLYRPENLVTILTSTTV